MSLATRTQRAVATGLLLAGALLVLAPAARADGHGRYKGRAAGWGGARSHVVFRDRGPGAGPVLAGLVGGFILGSAFSHAQPVVVHEHASYPHGGWGAPPAVGRGDCDRPVVRYGYYDPYCDRTFDTLEDARWDALDHRHPRRVRVIDLGSGECVRTLHLSDGRWVDDDDWDD